MSVDLLSPLWKKGVEFLGSPYALLGGAMTWLSERNLVSAISNAGGFGVLACGSMNPRQLREEIKATKFLTQAPFGVNLIVLHPSLEELAHVCIEEKVTHVVLAGGIPTADILQKLKANGTKTLAFAPSLIVARKLVRLGIGALIIEGSEAGGHVGPVSTSVLAQEILPHMQDVPVFVAGGIGRGEAILAYLEMGASGCQLGTRFVCAAESQAHPHFKQAFIRAQARDAVLSLQVDPRFPVIPVRALANNATRRFADTQLKVIKKFNEGELSHKEAQLEIEHFWAGALRRAVIEGDVKNGSLMAGQSVGMVTAIETVQDILQQLMDQVGQALTKR